MRDLGHEETERLIRRMEREVAEVYQQAAKETQEKLADYLERFKTKDAIWQRKVEAGEASAKEWAEWRKGQLIVGDRWARMQTQLANDMHNANGIARSVVMGYRPEVYAINHNFATYQIERLARVNTGYTLYSRETIERILREQPELLPPPGKQMQKKLHDYKMATGKDVAWQKGQIQSVMMQCIVQGESIPGMAKRIATTLGEFNHSASIRYARTAVTGAQNAGRVDAYHRAEELGIELEQQWVATIDNRTRHEHRQLDRQTAKVGEPFKVDGYEIMFPGDPEAEPEMIWNCRCTLIPAVKGLTHNFSRRSLSAIDGKSYEEWKAERVSESHSIYKQEEIAETMKRRYWKELYSDENS